MNLDRLVTLEAYVTLRGLPAEQARQLAAWPIVTTAAHELGHALTLRGDGWPIVFLTTIPGLDYAGMVITGAAPEDWCWRHDCMGMNPLVMAMLNGDVDSGWHAAG